MFGGHDVSILHYHQPLLGHLLTNRLDWSVQISSSLALSPMTLLPFDEQLAKMRPQNYF